MRRLRNKIRLRPAQIMVLGFAVIIIIGACVLRTPAATRAPGEMGFFDALFTATSAVCVTGLTLGDISQSFTMFGQITLLALIQIGGLGFMTFATLIMMLLRRKISLRERLLIQHSMGEFSIQGMVRLVQRIASVSFCIELLGAGILATRLIPKLGFTQGLYRSVFLSISAFCNAGFDVGGSGAPLEMFLGDYVVCFVIMALVILGGLGFTVLLDVYEKQRFNRLTSHAKVVLTASAALVILGFAATALLEWNNPATLGAMSVPQRLTAALFHTVNCRSAGFSLIDQAGLTDSTRFISAIMMFIGSAPGGTGGGVKITAFSIIMMSVVAVMTGRDDVMVGKKQVSRETVMRALAIVVTSLVLSCGVIIALSIIEQGNPVATFDNVFALTLSAYATTGMPEALTPTLSPLSQGIIMLTMFAGRVGPLTILLSMAARQKQTVLNIKYPEARIMVG